MAHGSCPAFKVGGLCCLFGTFKSSANSEIALALTSRFLPGNPCCCGIKEVIQAGFPAQTACQIDATLWDTWPLLAYTPGMETSLPLKLPTRPLQGSVLTLFPK